VDKQIAHMGDMIAVKRGASVLFEGAVSGVTGGEIEVILDGHRTSLLKDPRISSTAQSFEFRWRGDGKRHWIRLDVRDSESHLALIGNPLYLR